jgi:hypothetical protein
MGPAVLAEAGAKDADLLIACAAQDETNLVCSTVAQMLLIKKPAWQRRRVVDIDEPVGLLLQALAHEGLAFVALHSGGVLVAGGHFGLLFGGCRGRGVGRMGRTKRQGQAECSQGKKLFHKGSKNWKTSNIKRQPRWIAAHNGLAHNVDDMCSRPLVASMPLAGRPPGACPVKSGDAFCQTRSARRACG